MKNWKIIAIIIATAVATATAVVLVLQKSRQKSKMRFDSSEFDDDDFMNDVYNYGDENEEEFAEPDEDDTRQHCRSRRGSR